MHQSKMEDEKSTVPCISVSAPNGVDPAPSIINPIGRPMGLGSFRKQNHHFPAVLEEDAPSPSSCLLSTTVHEVINDVAGWLRHDVIGLSQKNVMLFVLWQWLGLFQNCPDPNVLAWFKFKFKFKFKPDILMLYQPLMDFTWFNLLVLCSNLFFPSPALTLITLTVTFPQLNNGQSSVQHGRFFDGQQCDSSCSDNKNHSFSIPPPTHMQGHNFPGPDNVFDLTLLQQQQPIGPTFDPGNAHVSAASSQEQFSHPSFEDFDYMAPHVLAAPSQMARNAGSHIGQSSFSLDPGHIDSCDQNQMLTTTSMDGNAADDDCSNCRSSSIGQSSEDQQNCGRGHIFSSLSQQLGLELSSSTSYRDSEAMMRSDHFSREAHDGLQCPWISPSLAPLFHHSQR